MGITHELCRNVFTILYKGRITAKRGLFSVEIA